MQRTQIQLTDEQVRRLRWLSRRRNVSFADMVRQCVDKALSELAGAEIDDLAERYEQAASAIGAFRETAEADVARRHDEYLDEAFK